MTYIKLEDVQNALNDKFEGVELDYITWKINSLPSINPESMIEEMIEKENSDWKSIYNEKELILLFAILQRFKS